RRPSESESIRERPNPAASPPAASGNSPAASITASSLVRKRRPAGGSVIVCERTRKAPRPRTAGGDGAAVIDSRRSTAGAGANFAASGMDAAMAEEARPGRIESIHVADSQGQPMRAVDRIRLIAGVGLAGDRY